MRITPQAVAKAVSSGRVTPVTTRGGFRFAWPDARFELLRKTSEDRIPYRLRGDRGIPVPAAPVPPELAAERCANCAAPSKVRGLCGRCYSRYYSRSGRFVRVGRGALTADFLFLLLMLAVSRKCYLCKERKPKDSYTRKNVCGDCSRAEVQRKEESKRLRGCHGRSSSCYCVSCDKVVQGFANDMCRKCYSAWYRGEPGVRERIAEQRKRLRSELTDAYVRNKLQMTKEVAPPELIEAKRVQLQLTRLVEENT
jgi:hypothetical protein